MSSHHRGGLLKNITGIVNACQTNSGSIFSKGMVVDAYADVVVFAIGAIRKLGYDPEKVLLEGKVSKVKVKPKIIVEVGYEEIQKSPSYKSGFALRFPRLIRLRPDKSLSDIDSLERVKRLYNQQRGGSNYRS